MYAFVEIQGGQYKAEQGGLLRVNKVATEKGQVVELDKVLLVRNDEKVTIGEPYVEGAVVKAVVEDHLRGEKIIVHKYKRRKRYKRTRGHRQQYSLLRVREINA